ncbi:MAG TPA: DNA helicase Rep [Nevskiales bacterium]|nr:DNA helicase Rep [Nevskiales bacterium]
MDTLNPQQRAAVRYIDGPLLVLAGAGSGKTRVITQKIAYLIRDCGIPARAIAAVTFTNKAAREMQERVGKLLKSGEVQGLRVSTFHTLGLDIVRRELKALGYRPGFSIYDARDSLQLIQALAAQEDEAEASRIQWLISHWKNALVSPEAALAEARDAATLSAARVYGVYQKQLLAYNALDFDDLIGQPLRLLGERPDIREAWQGRIRYLLVDEYQDTNACQYQLVKALIGVRGALTAVGDDDQSIYAWRGAQPQNLRLLAEDYPQLKIIKLEQNYRSSRRILKAANHLIRHNPRPLGEKNLWSELGHGEPIRVLVCKHAEHEAEKVVTELITHRFKSRAAYRDYAILYRSNHQSRLFEKVLREHRVPYQLSGAQSFFDNAEVKDLLAYLRLLTNPEDDAAFLRIVNTPRREIGPATLEKLAGYAAGRGIPLLQACSELGLRAVLEERAALRLAQFAHWLEELAERGRHGEPVAAVRDLIQEMRYAEWLKDQASNPKTAERRMANVLELVDWLARMGETAEGAASTLAERVARLTLYTLLDQGQDAGERDAVHLMTLHAAKGLEFPHVFLVGLEEDILPHRNSIDGGQIEEERRLLYVGITRAQQSLTLSYAQRRKRYGEWEGCIPSRFLQELPAEELEWEGAGQEVAPELRQERGRAHLANLRGLLGRG